MSRVTAAVFVLVLLTSTAHAEGRIGDAPLPPAMMRDASTCSIAGVRTAVDAPAPADSASPAGDAESAR